MESSAKHLLCVSADTNRWKIHNTKKCCSTNSRPQSSKGKWFTKWPIKVARSWTECMELNGFHATDDHAVSGHGSEPPWTWTWSWMASAAQGQLVQSYSVVGLRGSWTLPDPKAWILSLTLKPPWLPWIPLDQRII